jgi:hypothetical protein
MKFLVSQLSYLVLERDAAQAAELHGDGLPVTSGDPESSETWRAAPHRLARQRAPRGTGTGRARRSITTTY